ncbi:hypothetical protein ACJQWK_00565 [Exserohilum turcicum]
MVVAEISIAPIQHCKIPLGPGFPDPHMDLHLTSYPHPPRKKKEKKKLEQFAHGPWNIEQCKQSLYQPLILAAPGQYRKAFFFDCLLDQMATPPPRSRSAKPHLDSPTRARFFEAIDGRGQSSIRSIIKTFNISPATGYKLLHDRQVYGALADRRGELRRQKARETGTHSGRPPKNRLKNVTQSGPVPVPSSAAAAAAARPPRLDIAAAQQGYVHAVPLPQSNTYSTEFYNPSAAIATATTTTTTTAATTMSATQTMMVPHLGGITASYRLSSRFEPSKPTLVLVNSFLTSAALYDSFFANEAVTSRMNLLAIELLGHGQTRAHKVEHWTYWDTAMMNLQVMEALGIQKAFVLGTSQGGWVTVRMALLSPSKILGIMPLGSSLDYESERSRQLGCWEALEPLAAMVTGELSAKNNQPTPDFAPTDAFGNFLVEQGFGPECPADVKDYWIAHLQNTYKGDEGRRRMRMAAICLRDRDGLHLRAADVTCPVLWLHGTKDTVYSVANAQEEIKLFTNSPEARLEIIEGGQHFLNASKPNEVMDKAIAFVTKYAPRAVSSL